MLVRHEDCRAVERTLTELEPCRSGRLVACSHRHVWPPGKDVQRVRVHEATVVVPHIDHDPVPALVLRVEIEEELVERALPHVEEMDVTEATVAGFRHVGPPFLNPLSIQQPFLSRRVDGSNRHVALNAGRRCDAHRYLLVGSVREQ